MSRTELGIILIVLGLGIGLVFSYGLGVITLIAGVVVLLWPK